MQRLRPGKSLRSQLEVLSVLTDSVSVVWIVSILHRAAALFRSCSLKKKVQIGNFTWLEVCSSYDVRKTLKAQQLTGSLSKPRVMHVFKCQRYSAMTAVKYSVAMATPLSTRETNKQANKVSARNTCCLSLFLTRTMWDLSQSKFSRVRRYFVWLAHFLGPWSSGRDTVDQIQGPNSWCSSASGNKPTFLL